MQLVLDRLKDNLKNLKNDSARKQNSNDELVDKIHELEDNMKTINDDIE